MENGKLIVGHTSSFDGISSTGKNFWSQVPNAPSHLVTRHNSVVSPFRISTQFLHRAAIVLAGVDVVPHSLLYEFVTRTGLRYILERKVASAESGEVEVWDPIVGNDP